MESHEELPDKEAGSAHQRNRTCPLLTPGGNDILGQVIKRATRERAAWDGKNPERNRQMWLDFTNAYDLEELRDLLDQCLHNDVVKKCLGVQSVRDLDGLPVADLDDRDSIDALEFGEYSGWYLIMAFDQDEDVEGMFYVGQTSELRWRVNDHRKIIQSGSKTDSLVYFTCSRPNKHSFATYLGHIKPGQFDQLLHLQCFLTLGEEVLSVYLQSLHTSLLGRYLDETEILHQARGLQRKYPLEGGMRGAVSALVWLTSSDNNDYRDFARHHLAINPVFSFRWALEQGLIRTAEPGDAQEVKIECPNCGFSYPDPAPYYINRGRWSGHYIQRGRGCLMKCGGLFGSATLIPADPQLPTINGAEWSNIVSLYKIWPELKPTPKDMYVESWARPPKNDEPREVVLQCQKCKSIESMTTDDKPTFRRLGRPVYIARPGACRAICGGAGPASVTMQIPADPAIKYQVRWVVALNWNQHLRKIMTNHTLDKFITNRNSSGPPKDHSVDAQGGFSSHGSRTDAKHDFARYSIWHYLGPEMDESNTEEIVEMSQAVNPEAQDDFTRYSIWHYLGPEMDKSNMEEIVEKPQAVDPEAQDDFTRYSFWNYLEPEADKSSREGAATSIVAQDEFALHSIYAYLGSEDEASGQS